MKIILLGTGGYHPSELRHTACLLIPEWGLMLDAGTAVFRVPAQLTTPELDVFLSHAHFDHIIGLTYLLAPMVLKQVDAVRIHATQPVINAVREHLFAEPVFPAMPDFEFLPLKGGSWPLNKVATIRWQPLMSHPGSSMGYRIDWRDSTGVEKSLAYITDTTVDGSYRDFIRDVDLLIHECYFADDNEGWATKTGHSHTGDVLRLARETGVKQLALTHVDPRQSNADPVSLAKYSSEFPNTLIATDNLELEI